MKLTDIAKKPQLVKLTIDDADIIEEFGEPLEFYTQDRQPLDVFIKITAAMGKDSEEVVQLLKALVLDEAGQPVLANDQVLPPKIAVRALTRVMDQLGK